MKRTKLFKIYSGKHSPEPFCKARILFYSTSKYFSTKFPPPPLFLSIASVNLQYTIQYTIYTKGYQIALFTRNAWGSMSPKACILNVSLFKYGRKNILIQNLINIWTKISFHHTLIVSLLTIITNNMAIT